jgi:hypothetical protein
VQYELTVRTACDLAASVDGFLLGAGDGARAFGAFALHSPTTGRSWDNVNVPSGHVASSLLVLLVSVLSLASTKHVTC